jgi:hypothetical protein
MNYEYDISIDEIHLFEGDKYIEGKNHLPKNLLADLSEKCQNIIIKKGKPFLFAEDRNSDDPNKRDYYAKYDILSLKLHDLKEQFKHRVFTIDGNYYSFRKPIILHKDDPYFIFFFALKLRQFESNIVELRKFILYQLEKEFENNYEALVEFLEDVILTYNKFIPKNVIKKKGVIESYLRSNFKTEEEKQKLREEIERQELEDVILEDHFNDFLALEKHLVRHNFLSEEKEWINERYKSNYIVTLFHILREKLDWIDPLKKTKRKLKLIKYSRFFSNRYKISLKSHFNGRSIKNYSSIKYIADFQPVFYTYKEENPIQFEYYNQVFPPD